MQDTGARREPNRRKLTEFTVTQIKPPERGNVIMWDQLLPRFGVRLSHTGKRVWVVALRDRGAWTRFAKRVLGAQWAQRYSAVRLAPSSRRPALPWRSISYPVWTRPTAISRPRELLFGWSVSART